MPAASTTPGEGPSAAPAQQAGDQSRQLSVVGHEGPQAGAVPAAVDQFSVTVPEVAPRVTVKTSWLVPELPSVIVGSLIEMLVVARANWGREGDHRSR